MKSVSLILLLLLTLCSSSIASDFAISLDTVVGLYEPNSLNTNQQITFYLRVTNSGTYPMKGITNGFRIYSPNGATWDTTIGDNDLGTLGSSDFDLIWVVNEFSLTGSGSDTLGFGGATLSGSGLAAGFDDTAYTITIGPIPALDHGKTICIDSCFYPPSGIWQWSGGEVGGVLIGERVPEWTGPHCYTIVDAGGGQCLLPNPLVIKLETEEGNPSAGQSLGIDVFDTGNPLNFSLANGPSWLDLSADSGTTPATITASASVAGLPVGEVRETVTLTAAGASNSPMDVQVILKINPVLSATPYWGFLVVAEGGQHAPEQTLIVTATDGSSQLDFDVTTSEAWLSVSPSSGTTPETLVVTSDGRDMPVSVSRVPANIILSPTSGGLASTEVLYEVIIQDIVTAVREIKNQSLPQDYSLSQNYPNPFNPSTQIAFELPTRSKVRLAVYNVLGRRVATLVNESLAAGRWETEWDGRSASGVQVASGIYFYRLQTESFTQTKKMILLK